MRYEKGKKDASRSRILEVAAEHFRNDGISASGIAGIMSDAGLTNGAFYPHFQSKAELVRDSVSAMMEDQKKLLRETLVARGLEAVITTYLSAEHRDNPAEGCPLAALLPELAREPFETRSLYADRLLALVHEISVALPPETEDSEGVALGLYATAIGSLQLARTVEGTELSDRILIAGADAMRALIKVCQNKT